MNLYKNPQLIDWNNPIVIDFETYYDKEYTLKKVTTERYIRDSRFECIGVSIKVGDKPTKFYRRGHGVEIVRNLVQMLPRSPVVSHNNTFDMGILGLRYNIHPKIMVDTGTLAKLSGFDRVACGTSIAKLGGQLVKMGIIKQQKGDTVHNMIGVHADDMTEQQWVEYGDYCCIDTDIAYALYMYLISKVTVEDLIMADITTKMWTKPLVDLDVPLLTEYAKRLEVERETMLQTVAGKLGFNSTEDLLKSLRSADKFVPLLERFGVEVPMKWSPKKECMTPALSKTDLEFVDLLEHPNPMVATLVETKLGAMSSMEQTRTATFLDIASRGLMPIPLRYASAHTGRYGGSDKINLQNLSKRTKDPVLRRSMRAKKGYAVLASDSSQIEARLNAFISGQDDLTELFIKQQDPYVDMATAIFNKSYDEIYHEAKVVGSKDGKRMRNLGKEAVLACGYGMSANTFRNRMLLSGNTEAADMADEIVGAYHRKNDRIIAFWRECDKVLSIMYAGGSCWFGGDDGRLFYADGSSVFHGVKIPTIRLPNGSYLFYQNLRKESGDNGRAGFVYDQFKGRGFQPKRIWGSSLVENLCQSLAFAILKWQAIEIAKAGVSINLNVHDEWVSVVPRHQLTSAVIVHYKAMKSTPSYIPDDLLDCEVDVGHNYADLKTVDVGKFLTPSKPYVECTMCGGLFSEDDINDHCYECGDVS